MYVCISYNQRVGKQILFVSPQTANGNSAISWVHSANCKFRKFPWYPSPQIASPQICKEKSSVSDFLYLRKNILDYEMLYNSKLLQKSKSTLKFEWGNLWKVQKSLKKFCLKICRFAIWGTYLWTAHLCLWYICGFILQTYIRRIYIFTCNTCEEKHLDIDGKISP